MFEEGPCGTHGNHIERLHRFGVVLVQRLPPRQSRRTVCRRKWDRMRAFSHHEYSTILRLRTEGLIKRFGHVVCGAPLAVKSSALGVKASDPRKRWAV